jgi:hypothetical protein
MINRTHRRFIRCAVLAALIFSREMPAQSPSSSGDATLHVNSTEVLVDVVVTDKKGNIPRDLTAQNFRILEDSREQKIVANADGASLPSAHAERCLDRIVGLPTWADTEYFDIEAQAEGDPGASQSV